jgi:hypothetical protein
VTIREYIERRGLVLRYLAMALMATMFFVAVYVFPRLFDQITRRERAVCFLPVLALYGFFAVTTKCPRCHANLRESIEAVAMPFSSLTPDRCPQCDLGFDEPMNHGTR